MVGLERMEVWPLQHELAEGYGGSRRFVAARTATLVRIVRQDGVVGWGECFGPPLAVAAALRLLAPAVLALDADEPAGTAGLLREAERRGMLGGALAPAAIAGVDIALWDALARSRGASVASVLGVRNRERVDAYASTGNVPADRDNRRIDDDVAEAIELGFRAVKIRVGCGPDDDADRVGRARRALGEKVRLMVDVNANYPLHTARESIRAIRDFDVHWIEEPLAPEDEAGYARLAADRGRPLIAAGEATSSLAAFRAPLEARSFDVVQPDPTIVLGFTGFRAVAQLAGLCGVLVAPHCWGAAISQLVALQLLGWLPIEPGGDEDAAALEWDLSVNPLRTELLAEPLVLDPDGRVTVPKGPGLGADVDVRAVRPFVLDGGDPAVYQKGEVL